MAAEVAIRDFTVTVHDDGRVTLRATDAAKDGQAWAVDQREIPLDRLRVVADQLGIRGQVEAGLAMVLDRLERHAAAEEGALARAREARAAVNRLKARLAPPRVQYCGGGMTDVGSLHAPHKWAQDPEGRECPGHRT